MSERLNRAILDRAHIGLGAVPNATPMTMQQFEELKKLLITLGSIENGLINSKVNKILNYGLTENNLTNQLLSRLINSQVTHQYITYNALLDLKSNNNLIPGLIYIIIDFPITSATKKVAVVKALTESVLDSLVSVTDEDSVAVSSFQLTRYFILGRSGNLSVPYYGESIDNVSVSSNIGASATVNGNNILVSWNIDSVSTRTNYTNGAKAVINGGNNFYSTLELEFPSMSYLVIDFSNSELTDPSNTTTTTTTTPSPVSTESPIGDIIFGVNEVLSFNCYYIGSPSVNIVFEGKPSLISAQIIDSDEVLPSFIDSNWKPAKLVITKTPEINNGNYRNNIIITPSQDTLLSEDTYPDLSNYLPIDKIIKIATL